MTLEEKLKHYGLSLDEHTLAQKIVGQRDLSQIEWALFSSLWSEHCSYKSSKVHLKNLYGKSDVVVSEDGENAGVVDLGMGERVAFKMESHNHPSFIEPFQGAATGVGGILRDIFTMGARPIALSNYLCFGASGSERLENLVTGVVSGISFYGNCVGVPNISGQTEFNKTYNTNNLVNAFALGYYGKNDKIVSSKIKTPGHALVYVGAKTGKDGVHGASMASESFDEGSEAKRPTVQIGDPFFEKLLIESCLEVMGKELAESVQDMGAAGITSSSFEMSVGGGLGLELDLSKVPLRDQTMDPEEILLSESQERMLMACDPKNVEEIQSVFSKWGLEAVVIGKVRAEKEIQIFWKGDLVCEIDPSDIVEGAPRYERPFEIAPWVESEERPVAADYELSQVFQSLQGCSREWIYNQYDQRVGAKTVADCSSPIGVVRLPESGRPLGLVLGCRPLLMELNAELGGFDAVLSPAVQLSLKGFKPWAVTDCLNFGNPQKSVIMGEFVASLRKMSEACELFKAPIISGNVSLYNETEGQNITSTPATCVVGLRDQVLSDDNLDQLPTTRLQKVGSKLLVVETEQFEWSGYTADMLGQKPWGKGELNPKVTKDFCDYLRPLALSGDFKSSKLVSKFGALYALTSMMTEHLGVDLDSKVSLNSLKQEKLYQVILEVDADYELPHSDFKVTQLGVVTADPVLKAADFKMTFEEMQRLKNLGWEKNFGA